MRPLPPFKPTCEFSPRGGSMRYIYDFVTFKLNLNFECKDHSILEKIVRDIVRPNIEYVKIKVVALKRLPILVLNDSKLIYDSIGAIPESIKYIYDWVNDRVDPWFSSADVSIFRISSSIYCTDSDWSEFDLKKTIEESNFLLFPLEFFHKLKRHFPENIRYSGYGDDAKLITRDFSAAFALKLKHISEDHILELRSLGCRLTYLINANMYISASKFEKNIHEICSSLNGNNGEMLS